MFLNFGLAIGFYFYAVEYDKYLGVEEPNNTSSFYKKHKYNKLGLVSDKKKASNIDIFTANNTLLKPSTRMNVVEDLSENAIMHLRTSDPRMYINAHSCMYSLFSQVLTLRTSDKKALGRFKFVKGSQMGYRLMFNKRCAKYNPTKNKLSFENCNSSNIVEFQILTQLDRDGLSKTCEDELKSHGIGVSQLQAAEITDDHDWKDYSNNNKRVFTKKASNKENMNQIIVEDDAVIVKSPETFNFDIVKIGRSEVPIEEKTIEKFPVRDDLLGSRLGHRRKEEDS